MPAPLTELQAEMLAAICAHWRAHGRPPTVRDLMRATGHNSPNGVTNHLKGLERKGEVEIDRTAPNVPGIWPAGWRGRIRRALADDTTPAETRP